MKKRFVALMMMVAMTATLVACSGKDAPKENTTAGTNDSAVEATTGTTTQDVAESNEETTTPDVSEVEEDQVGETSVGTVGGSDSETTPKGTSDLFEDGGQANNFAPDLGKTQVKIYKDDPSKGQHGIIWYPSEKWNYDGVISVCFDAYMPVDTGYLARFYKPTDTYGFETFNIADTSDKEAVSKYGLNETNLMFRNLGDLSSNSAWEEQLNRDWDNMDIKYEDGAFHGYNYSNGQYTTINYADEQFIEVIKDCQVIDDSQTYKYKGYTNIFVERSTGLEYTFTYIVYDDGHYNDNDAFNVAKSFTSAKIKE